MQRRKVNHSNDTFLVGESGSSPWIQSNLKLWESILDARNILCVPEKTVVFLQGDPATHVVVVQRGRLMLSLTGESGAEKILMFAGKGCIIGEQALVDHSRYQYRTETLEESCYYRIPAALFKEYLDTSKEVSRALMINQLDKCNALTGHIADLSFDDARRRLIRELLYLSEQFGKRVEEGLLIRQRLSQEDLGKRIGTSRVTVNKLLGELEQEGLLHRTGQRLILDDISGLEMELKNPERTRSRK